MAADLAASIALSFSSFVISPAGAGVVEVEGLAAGCEGSLPHAVKIIVMTAAARSKDFMRYLRLVRVM